MTVPTLSLTETQVFTALRAYLQGVLPAAAEVIRAEGNRVPEPTAADFVLMNVLRQPRLSTNITDYFDNVLTGSIAGTVLSVSAIAQQESPLSAGMLLIDGNYPTMTEAPNTILGAQLSGTPGGIGTYQVSPSQTLASEALYAGVRADLAPEEWTVQLDVHGPNSGDNARVIEALFRSEYATAAFEATGYDVQPLYSGEPRQIPFVNDQQQYEYRWVIELAMQINPVIGTPQQFAAEVVPVLLEIDAAYPP